MIPCVIAINSSSTIYIDSAPTLSAATTLTDTVVIELGNRHYAQVWGDNVFFASWKSLAVASLLGCTGVLYSVA